MKRLVNQVFITRWVTRLHFRCQMVVNLRNIKLARKALNKVIFKLCKCIPNFSLIVRGEGSSMGVAVEFLFNKVAGLKTWISIKKRLQHRCFPVNIAKFLRTSILKNICEQLLLKRVILLFRIPKKEEWSYWGNG